MNVDHALTDLASRIREAMTRDFLEPATFPFETLALELFKLQFDLNPGYRAFCLRCGVTPDRCTDWRQVPAVPTAAFKELAMSCLPEAERSRVFFSSGTAGQTPSRHYHSTASLALYEGSLWPWFERHLLGEPGAGGGADLALVFLTPPPAQAPNSSLVHMFETVRRQLGASAEVFAGYVSATGEWRVDAERAVKGLSGGGPVLVAGTAFAFVHFADWLEEARRNLRLPAGSRVLETGGYKGRSRSMPREELHALIAERLGISRPWILSEYGMSELSSQAYDGVVGAPEAAPRGFRFPPWARARVVSPEHGGEVADGDAGLIRVHDLANAFSVMAIQTEDLAVRRGSGFELIGRAAGAEPRGCSLMSGEAVS